jgi:hypothetical protein
MKLVEMMSREEPVVEQVSELLSLDSAGVDEILRLANSPVFGFQTQIRNLAHAVVLLGARRLKALAATVALMRTSDARGLCDLWNHSAASAFLAARLAENWDRHDAYAAVRRADSVDIDVPAELVYQADDSVHVGALTQAACEKPESLWASPPAGGLPGLDAALGSLAAEPGPSFSPCRKALACAARKSIEVIYN